MIHEFREFRGRFPHLSTLTIFGLPFFLRLGEDEESILNFVNLPTEESFSLQIS